MGKKIKKATCAECNHNRVCKLYHTLWNVFVRDNNTINPDAKFFQQMHTIVGNKCSEFEKVGEPESLEEIKIEETFDDLEGIIAGEGQGYEQVES